MYKLCTLSKIMSWCSIAVKIPWPRQLSQRKNLIGSCLQLQSFSLLSSWWETWCHGGRQVMDKQLEISKSRSRDKEWHQAWFEHLKTKVYSQLNTSSNKTTLPNPCHVEPLRNDQAFKYVSLSGPFLFKSPQIIWSSYSITHKENI